MTEHARGRWRQGLRSGTQDAVAKALRHDRFDLFYGSHYLRFTRTRDRDGAIRLRLEERARLVGGDGQRPELRTADQIGSPFAWEASQDECAPRLFFERAAHLLDEYEE